MSASQGKIARLPFHIREDLNRRLLDGAMGPQILPWLNGLPEMKAVCDEWFDGQPVNAQNLSAWRLGEYRAWLGRRERVERTREKASYAVDLVKASGLSLSAGAIQLAAGEMMELMEAAPGGEEGERPDAKAFGQWISDLVKLSNEDAKHKRLALEEAQLAEARAARNVKEKLLELAWEKLERDFAAKVVEAAQREDVRAIVARGGDPAAMIAELRPVLFGDREARRREWESELEARLKG